MYSPTTYCMFVFATIFIIFFSPMAPSCLNMHNHHPAGGRMLINAMTNNPLIPPPSSASSYPSSDNDSPHMKLKRALQFHKQNDLTTAVQAYEEILPFFAGATKATILTNLGKINSDLGALDKSYSNFLEAIDHDPSSSNRYLNMGIFLYNRLNDYENALAFVKKAILFDNSNQQAMQMMGVIHQSLGDHDIAGEYFVFADRIATSSSATTATSPKLSLKSHISLLSSIDPSASSLYSSEEKEVKKESMNSPRPLIKVLSDIPKLFYVKNFLSPEELDHILALSETSRFESSEIMSTPQSSPSNLSRSSHSPRQCGNTEKEDNIPENIPENTIPFRHSSTAWLNHDITIRSLHERLAGYLGISKDYVLHSSEQLQLVKYGLHGQYLVHPDSLSFHKRLFTALIYLKAPRTGGGGATWFPFASSLNLASSSSSSSSSILDLEKDDDVVFQSQPPLNLSSSSILSFKSPIDEGIQIAMDFYNDCSNSIPNSLPGLVVTPPAGSAIIFFNHLDDGTIDPNALHAGLPVTDGDKMIANIWVKLDEKGLELFSSTKHRESE